MIFKITLTGDPKVVEVRFSDAPIVHQFAGEVIADVNRLGNWVRGLEVIGSGLPFSLELALASLSPQHSVGSVPCPQDTLTVTYDEDANAGFLYLPYASPLTIEQRHKVERFLLKSSYTLSDPEASFGLAADKSLIFIRFAIPSAEDPEKFTQLFLS